MARDTRARSDKLPGTYSRLRASERASGGGEQEGTGGTSPLGLL